MAKGRRAPAPIVIVAALAGFVVASAGMRALLDWWRREPSVPYEVAHTTWHEEQLGARIEFEAPAELHAEPLPVPPELADVMEFTNFLTNEGDGLNVSALVLTVREGKPIDLDGAADGALANLRGPPGTLSVDPARHDDTVVGVRAIVLEALIRRDHADSLRFRGVTFALGRELYIFSMIARADQDAAATAWNRLRSSIRAR